MFTNKEDIQNETRKELRQEQELQRLRDKVATLENEKWDAKQAQESQRLAENEALQLKADLKIAKAAVESSDAKARSEMAGHVLDLEDSRTASLEVMYKNFASSIVDIVKAAHTGGSPIQQTITNSGK